MSRRERVDSEAEIGLTPGIGERREDVINEESKDTL